MSTYSVSELITCILSRQLVDGEVAIMGAVGAIPEAACRLAQRRQAPSLWYMAGGSGAVNPHLAPYLVPSSCDMRLLNADGVMPLSDVVLLEGRGDRVDVFFAGGLQIDAYGNCNLICVGDWAKPKLRGPGTVGLPFLCRAGRTIIYTQAHNPRTLVERVDFRSGQGFLGGPAEWAAAGFPTRGPVLLVTNLAVFDFHPVSRRARLISVHPGAKVEDVLAQTGFQPEVADTVAETRPPTAEELAILRQIDARGVLSR